MDNKLSAPSRTMHWVDRNKIKPNDYNPNKVSRQNLELLTQSIFTNGWTLPIVVRPDGTIIDGFHRWTVAGPDWKYVPPSEEDDRRTLYERLEGKVLVVIVDHKDKAKNIYGTVTHNRARGTHLLEPMKKIVKEAREILADDGKPKEEITIKLPDIPIIRKGDKIHIKTASISAGYYIVISATHDVDKMLMTLGLKKAPAAKKSSGNKKTKAKSYDVGDIVNFHGGKHYVSSYPDARGYSVGAGKAKITIKGGSGKAHPWHLVTQNWNQTHVWGWVDDGSFD